MPSFGERLLTRAIQSSIAEESRKRRALEKVEKDKVSLLADPATMDKLVADFTTMISPSRAKLGTDFASKVDAADANIPSDHPLKGYGHSLRDNLRAQLVSPENRGKSIEQLILQQSGRELIKKGKSGKSLYEEAHEYKYRKDYAPGNWFGLAGEDEDVRALPGYEEFKEEKAAITPKEITTTYKQALGFGAGFAGAGQLTRRAAIKWGGKRAVSWGTKRLVTGAALGPHVGLAAVAAVPAFKIFDATANVIERSHFGKSQGAITKLTTEVIIGGLIPAYAGHKILTKSIAAAAKANIIKGTAEKLLMRLPTARNAIVLGKARAVDAKTQAAADAAIKKETAKPTTKKQFFKAADDEYTRQQFEYRDLSRFEKQEMEKDLAAPFASIFTGARTARPKNVGKIFASFTDEQSDAALVKAKTIGIRKATQQVKEGADVLEDQRVKEIRDGIHKGLKETDEYLIPKKLYTTDDLISPFKSKKQQRLTTSAEKKVSKTQKAAKEVNDAVDKEILAVKMTEVGEDIATSRAAIAEMDKIFKGGFVQTETGAVIRKEGKKAVVQVPDEVIRKKEAAIPIPGKRYIFPRGEKLFKEVDETLKETTEVTKALKAKIEVSVDDITRYHRNIAIPAIKQALERGKFNEAKAIIQQTNLDKHPIGKKLVAKVEEGFEKYGTLSEKELKELAPFRTVMEELERVPVPFTDIPEDAVEISYREAKRRLLKQVTKKDSIGEAKLDGAIKNAETSVGKQVEKQQGRKLTEAEMSDAEWLARAGESETIEDIFATTDGLMKEEFDPSKWTFFLLAGVTVPLLSLISTDAQAGMTSEALKVAANSKVPKIVIDSLKAAGKSGKQLNKEIIEGGYTYIPAAEGQKFFGERMKAISVSEMVAERGERLSDQIIRSKSLPFGFDRLMSTAGFSRLFTKAGGEPAIELGNRHIVSGSMTEKGLQVADNIYSSVKNYNANPKEVIETMKPLAERFAGEVGAYNSVEYHIKAIKGIRNKALADLKKGKLKGLEKDEVIAGLKEAKISLRRLNDALEELAPTAAKFESNYQETIKILAKNNPSVRMSLAAEDTAKFKHNPWLEPLMTFEEKEAVGYYKKFMEEYAEEIARVYGKDAVIESRPYIHHAFHPSWKTRFINDELLRLKLGIKPHPPYTEWHSRSRYSKQMVPHIGYNTGRYIPDAEKRIQMREFWGIDKKNSWHALRQSPMVQGSDALREFFQRIHNAGIPASDHWSNKAANWYSAIEVFRLLGFSTSVAFKHLFKIPGTWAQLGFIPAAKHIPETIQVFARTFAQGKGGKDIARQLNLTGRAGEKAATDLIAKTFSRQYGYMNTIMDMDMAVNVNSTFETGLKWLNEKGGVFVRGVEHFDRSHGILAASEQAAKKGMTAKQAVYGLVDTILKNNFLSGTLNPSWMRSPKVRALFLFQNTAFKILERRIVGGIKTLELSKAAGKSIKEKGLRQTLKELRGIKQFIKEGEHEFKESIILDALNADRGYFGTPQSIQFMKEILIMGAIVGAGGVAGVDLWEHANHIPFLKGHTKYPVLATSPIFNAMFDVKANRAAAAKASKAPEFLMTDFLKEWLWQGKYGPYPQSVKKLMRLSDDDIPKRYKDSKFKYLFSIPATE